MGSKLKYTFKYCQIKFYAILAAYNAKKTQPEDIKFDISTLVKSSRKIKIAVIDDDQFPWEDALNETGFETSTFKDYTLPLKQSNQKIKSINLEKYDAIIVDINGIGTEIFKDSQGLGVIESLREKFPFKVIIAYTASPGIIITKRKDNIVDAVFSKDWSEDDFLFNTRKIKDILSTPQKRWLFLEKRLREIGATEKQILNVKISFTKSMLFYKYIGKRPSKTEDEMEKIIIDSENLLNTTNLLQVGKYALKISEIILPTGANS